MSRLPEYEELLVLTRSRLVRTESLATVSAGADHYEVLGLSIGAEDRTVPTFGVFGGVHGLERIGTQTVLAFLRALLQNLTWDEQLRARLERCRIVAVPLVNPGGMAQRRRGNPRGVDLMRNAPVDAQGDVPLLVGGHRISPRLWWYRGAAGPMQPESSALCDFVSREMFLSDCALALDVHSGFGQRDRLWYPYAKRVGGYPGEAVSRSLKRLLDRTYPNHRYLIEPQSASYTTHGDLWDHLYDLHHMLPDRFDRLFLPWTLELGSWGWIRKNPRQLFMAEGVFNPVRPHRVRRVLRRHYRLLDFLWRASQNRAQWGLE